MLKTGKGSVFSGHVLISYLHRGKTFIKWDPPSIVSFSSFFVFVLIFIAVQLTYNVMLVSGVQQKK